METPLRVLLIEDSENDALLLIRKLKHAGYEPVYKRVDTRNAMEKTLESESWDGTLHEGISRNRGVTGATLHP